MTKQNNALRLAELQTADEWPGHMTLVSYARECAAELRRQYAELETLRARVQELEAHLILDCMTHVQKPSEIEHVADDVSKNWAELSMSAQQPAQPAPMLDYPPLPDFDTVEQHIYGACRRYITQDMLEPIHNLIRETVDADRAARAPADSVLEDAARLEFEMQHGSAIAAARKQGENHD
jgi:hypothetical protein